MNTEIIIPTYNGAEYLTELLESLVRQDTNDFGVIISDNGSSDSTITIAEEFSSQLTLNIIDTSSRPGKAFALNEAIRLCSNKSNILFIDQDDTVNEVYVSAMTKKLLTHPFVAASMDSTIHNNHFLVLPRDIPRYQKFGIFEVNIASGGTIGVQKYALEKIGLFDESFNYSTNDVEFCYRAYKKGFLLKIVGEAILNYRLRKTIPDNFFQGIYYGKGNFAIAQRYPEIRKDQKNTSWLLYDSFKILASLLIKKESRARNAHELGKLIGQLSSKIRAFDEI